MSIANNEFALMIIQWACSISSVVLELGTPVQGLYSIRCYT